MEQSRMYVSDGTDRVMVASFLDTPKEGAELSGLPPHLTYVSWFNLPHEYREDFYAHMEGVTEQNRAPKIMGGSQKLFTDNGSGEDVGVRRLDAATRGFNTISDFAPHAEILGFVKHVDPAFDDRYFGMKWKPHITDTAEYSLGQGEEVRLDNLTIVRRDKNIGRKVIERVLNWRHND